MTQQTLGWIIVVPASIAAGYLLDHWDIPAAWLLGSILAAGAFALIARTELHVNAHVYRAGRGLIGIIAGIPLTMLPATKLLGYLPIGIVVSFVTIAVGLIGGVLLHRAQPKYVSNETGILSLLPGGASMMPPLADELGADYRFVALTQYLRFLVVSISLPLVAGFLEHPKDASGAQAQPEPASQWWVWLIIVAIALAGQPLAKLLRIPVAPILGPLLLCVAVTPLLPEGVMLQPPELFRIFAFLVIGWYCGGGLSVSSLKHFAKQLPATIAVIATVIAVCALTAFPLAWVMGETYFEAYLATSPGALETVLALSSEGGAGSSVVALQLIRLIAVLLIAGYLPQLIRLFSRR